MNRGFTSLGPWGGGGGHWYGGTGMCSGIGVNNTFELRTLIMFTSIQLSPLTKKANGGVVASNLISTYSEINAWAI